MTRLVSLIPKRGWVTMTVRLDGPESTPETVEVRRPVSLARQGLTLALLFASLGGILAIELTARLSWRLEAGVFLGMLFGVCFAVLPPILLSDFRPLLSWPQRRLRRHGRGL